MKSPMRCLISSGLLIASLCVALPAAHAPVVTSNSLALSNFRITPSVGLLAIDPWTAEARAVANNSLGESKGPSDTITVTACFISQLSAASNASTSRSRVGT